MSEEIQKTKTPWWMSVVAALSAGGVVGGGTGSTLTFYLLEKVEARQASHEEAQVRKDSAMFALLWEIKGDVGQVKAEIGEIKGELKILRSNLPAQ